MFTKFAIDYKNSKYDQNCLTQAYYNIRYIKNYQNKDILFLDLEKVLGNGQLIQELVSMTLAVHPIQKDHKLFAIDSRGYILGIEFARQTGAQMIMVRKPGKTHNPYCISYTKEYDDNPTNMEFSTNNINPNDKCWIIDDILATGGTIRAVKDAIIKLGMTYMGAITLFDLNLINFNNKIQKMYPMIHLSRNGDKYDFCRIGDGCKSHKLFKRDSYTVLNYFVNNREIYCNDIPIFIGTSNCNKLHAMNKLYEKTDKSCIFYKINVPSSVDNQPIGVEMALQGARNRIAVMKHLASDLVKQYPNNVFHYVAIESYLDVDEEKKTATDIPVIIIDTMAKEHVFHGAPLSMDYLYYEMSRDSGYTETAGSLFERAYNLEKDGWFEFLHPNMNRVKQICSIDIQSVFE